MSAEENKAIAQRYWEELWNTGNLASIDEIFAPDYASSRIERMKRNISRWRTAFPDFRSTIEDIFAEGDKVVVQWTIRGTNRREHRDRVGRDYSPYREACIVCWHGHLSFQGWQDRGTQAQLGQAGPDDD